MADALELCQVSRTAYLWQAHEPTARSDLYATALALGSGLYLVDPIPIAPAALQPLLRGRTAKAIFVTNANHVRSAQHFADLLSVPAFAHSDLAGAGELHFARKFPSPAASELQVIDIPGGAAGEVALHHADDGGELVLGDALIHFEPYGFTFLPDKYCTDPKRLRRSLRALLDLSFERILFAHGTPIMERGQTRLEALLASAS